MIKQLKDYITIDDVVVNGANCITSLFTTLDSKYNSYLKAILNTDKDSLTLDYLGNRLDKALSPLYSRLIDKGIADGLDDEEAIIYANGKLIKIIESKYLYNWNRLAEAMFKDYNPINNYDMVETRDIAEQKGQSVSTSGKNDITQSSSENTKNNSEESNEESNETTTSTDTELTSHDEEKQNYAGFNSLEPKVVTTGTKDGSSSQVNKGSSEEVKSADKFSSSKEDKTASNTESETSSSSVESMDAIEDNSRQEELRRSGNIGVTTSQQMIESEIQLRKHNLEDIIFDNIDEVLFLDYYL